MVHCYGSPSRLKQRINKIRRVKHLAQFLVYTVNTINIFCYYYYYSFDEYLFSIYYNFQVSCHHGAYSLGAVVEGGRRGETKFKQIIIQNTYTYSYVKCCGGSQGC